MFKQPNNLHPEVFEEVWKKWSVLCANEEMAGRSVDKPLERKLWVAAAKIVDYNIRLDWMSFCSRYNLGVYK